ncbi:MAG: cell division protein FtsQ/DivIB [Phycisphaerae bacterium]
MAKQKAKRQSTSKSSTNASAPAAKSAAPGERFRMLRAIAGYRRTALRVLGLAAFSTLCGVGYYVIHDYVERQVTFTPEPPAVLLAHKPVWMTDLLAVQIAESVRPVAAHSSFDRQMLADRVALLEANPWVRQVKHVRRGYREAPGDLLEIDVEFREPVALVHWKNHYWLVDRDGVKLPEQFTAEQLPGVLLSDSGGVNLRVIEGVRHAPVESGEKWPGEDLAAGIALAETIFGQSFADEIVAVDVSNFGGREDRNAAQLVLHTVHQTQIRWGLPVTSTDRLSEVSPQEKLAALKEVFERYGRVDAGYPWLNVRFDTVTYPAGFVAGG